MANDTILKRKLAEAGISQAEVSRRMGLTPQHVNYVVNGLRESRRLSLEILAICNKQIHAVEQSKQRRSNRRSI